MVSDPGIGIKDEDQTKIFERYYRVDDSNLETIAGFGNWAIPLQGNY